MKVKGTLWDNLNGGQPPTEKVFWPDKEDTRVYGHVVVFNVPSSVFCLPLLTMEGTIRIMYSMYSVFFNGYIDSVWYDKKGTRAKWDYWMKMTDLFEKLEVEEDCPTFILIPSEYSKRYTTLPEKVTDPRHLDLIQRMATFWFSTSSRFYHLVYWAAARRGNLMLTTDYGPDDLLREMVIICMHFGGPKKTGGFPVKTRTGIELSDNPTGYLYHGYGAEREELPDIPCSDDPVDNLNRNGAGAGSMLMLFEAMVSK